MRWTSYLYKHLSFKQVYLLLKCFTYKYLEEDLAHLFPLHLLSDPPHINLIFKYAHCCIINVGALYKAPWTKWTKSFVQSWYRTKYLNPIFNPWIFTSIKKIITELDLSLILMVDKIIIILYPFKEDLKVPLIKLNIP
jgi:hypothetical protein